MAVCRPYDTGVIVGRFQTFHVGHQSLVEAGLRLCDRLYVFVGSSQESGTERNPFNVATRIKMIEECYPDDRVHVFALADLTNEEDIRPEWGRYVLDHIDAQIHKAPELMIYGNDEARSRWFAVEDIKDTAELIVARAKLPVSATQARALMAQDDRKAWMKLVDPRLHKLYDELRGELMSVEFYQTLGNQR